MPHPVRGRPWELPCWVLVWGSAGGQRLLPLLPFRQTAPGSPSVQVWDGQPPTSGVPRASHQPHVGLAGKDHAEHPCVEWVCEGLKPLCCSPATCCLGLAELSPSRRDLLQPGSGRDCQAAVQAGRVWLGQAAPLTPGPAPQGHSQGRLPLWEWVCAGWSCAHTSKL